MPAWLEEFIGGFVGDLFYDPFYKLAEVVWITLMDLSLGVIGKTPSQFSPSAWSYVAHTLYPWTLGIGLSMVNVFFICSFLKAVSNLKEQVTLELFIEGMIRLVAVNVLFQMGFNLMKTFFSMASAMSGEIIDFQGPPLFTEEVDIGSHLFWWLFGLLYFLVALVCGIMIFLTLYSRYIKLYMLVVCFPLTMPSLISGRGIDETAKAWLRNFLGNAFEVVVIALVISISGKIIGGFNLPESSFADFFDGFGQALKSLIYMIGMTGAVKGANNFMNKTFHL